MKSASMRCVCSPTALFVSATACFFLSLPVNASLVGHWHADDWNGSGNWTNRASNAFAEKYNDPLFSYSTFNGSKGIVFDDNDCFYVHATNNPAAKKTRFTLITLFKTATPGQNNNDRFWENSALVGGETPGHTTNDWALSILANGSPRAFFADEVITATDVYVLDNRPHTSAMTWRDTSDGGDGHMRFYVDGTLIGTTAPQDFEDGIVSNGFGIARGEYYPTETRGFFQGTIGEVRIYDSIEDVATLHETLVNDNPHLIGHWNADDYSGSGNWLDRVSGLTATVSGNPSVSANAVGTTSCTNGIYFDGNDRFDVFAANNPAVGQTKFTVIASFSTANGGLNNNANWWQNTGIVGAESPSSPNDWGLMLLQNGSAKFAFSSSTYTDGKVADGKLHTMALTWSDPDDGGDGYAHAYVDGQHKWSAFVNNGAGIVNDGFAIAAQQDGGTYYYTGLIGEVRIYNSIEDIAYLHEQMTDDAGVVGHWVADDWSGSGYWPDRIKNLNAVPGGTSTPVVVKDSIYTTTTRDGVFFDGGCRFDVPATNNPAVGATKFTVMTLFSTTTGGLNNNVADWWNNSAIVGAEAPTTRNDWGLILLQNGNAKAAFAGNQFTDGYVIDGNLHTLALTWSDPSFGGDAMMRVYVDGALKYTHHGHTNTDLDNGIYNYGFAIAAQMLGGNRYYTGTIGEVRLYRQLMNVADLHAEMTVPKPPPRGTILLLR